MLQGTIAGHGHHPNRANAITCRLALALQDQLAKAPARARAARRRRPRRVHLGRARPSARAGDRARRGQRRQFGRHQRAAAGVRNAARRTRRGARTAGAVLAQGERACGRHGHGKSFWLRAAPAAARVLALSAQSVGPQPAARIAAGGDRLRHARRRRHPAPDRDHPRARREIAHLSQRRPDDRCRARLRRIADGASCDLDRRGVVLGWRLCGEPAADPARHGGARTRRAGGEDRADGRARTCRAPRARSTDDWRRWRSLVR